MKDFALKFIDIMIGIVLGLGFQWWPDLKEPWQYAAFIFVYLDIIDYWIDYSPALKKFPPKSEIDLMLDVGIMFSLFLFIYATQITIIYFLAIFVLFRVFDSIWLLRAKYQYNPGASDRVFIDTWLKFNLVEIAFSVVLILGAKVLYFGAFPILAVFIVLRIATRVLASLRYKKVHFA